LRVGDFNALVSLLDPNLVVRTDAASATPALPTEVRGAEFWAHQVIKTAQGARAARAVLINGAVGLVIAPRGHLFRVLSFRFSEGKIAEIDVIGDQTTLAFLDLALLDQ
jgi:RNA polymerase sigma-70 factor (ECF subfamily)